MFPPQDSFNPNRSFTELGSWQIKKLGRRDRLHFFPWGKPNPPETDQSGGDTPPPVKKAPRHDPLALARFYQSLLDSRIVEIRLLRNPVYIGWIKWGDAESHDAHPAIISQEQFERVGTPPRLGLEQSRNAMRKTSDSEWRGADSGALRDSGCANDLQMARTIDLWQSLTPLARAALVAYAEGLAVG